MFVRYIIAMALAALAILFATGTFGLLREWLFG